MTAFSIRKYSAPFVALSTVLAFAQIAHAETDMPSEALVAPCLAKPAAERSFCVRNTLAGFINHTLETVSYSSARQIIFRQVDAYQTPDGRRALDSVYSSDVLVSGERSDVSFNIEHTWPKSKLKDFPRYKQSMADLFHLFPCENRINSIRSSQPFVDCNDGSSASSERLSHTCNGGFEPPAQHRGQVARAMFYMAVTYNLKIDAAQEAVLRKWNQEFPVTDSEIERDNRVHSVQQAHNPFILFPKWAELISDF